MELLEPSMQALFAQLGEANDEAAIARFVETHGHLRGQTRLHEAPFWSPSQSDFLRDAIALDANWALVVDTLNVRLHEAGLAKARASHG